MSSNRTLQIRTLLWKEWLQVRSFLLVPAALIVFPWLARALFRLSYGNYSDLSIVCRHLAFWLTGIGMGALAFGQEVADRSVHYISTRPVRKMDVLLAKISVGLVATVLIAVLAFLCMAPVIGHERERLAADHTLALEHLVVEFRMISILFGVFAAGPVAYFAALTLTFKFEQEVLTWLISVVGSILALIFVYALGWVFAALFIPLALTFHLFLSCPFRRLAGTS